MNGKRIKECVAISNEDEKAKSSISRTLSELLTGSCFLVLTLTNKLSFIE
jgi:hypothetical protein